MDIKPRDDSELGGSASTMGYRFRFPNAFDTLVQHQQEEMLKRNHRYRCKTRGSNFLGSKTPEKALQFQRATV